MERVLPKPWEAPPCERRAALGGWRRVWEDGRWDRGPREWPSENPRWGGLEQERGINCVTWGSPPGGPGSP